MQNIPVLFDIHTHSVASGHGSSDTITDMARAASDASLQLLGISEHGPKTPGSAGSSYFRNLRLASRKRFGITVLYGAELNILNENGDVDLEDSILCTLDYALVGMHHPLFTSGSASSNTDALIRSMKHPRVHFLAHPDDGRYPLDYERLLHEAAKRQVYPEINNASLTPDAYRTDGPKNIRHILSVCKAIRLPVLLSSDSHGKTYIGDMRYILPLLHECDFPQSLILNTNPSLLLHILKKNND